MKDYLTLENAVEAWKLEFNAIPIDLIRLAYGGTFEGVQYVWTCGNNADQEWATNNVETLEACGFKLLHTNEIGVFVAGDASSDWVSLYKTRGLLWHEPRMNELAERVRRVISDLVDIETDFFID